jgi:sialate O-acetylesterase
MRTLLSAARVAILAGLGLCARAEVELPYLISEHMVVQRELPVHVWGKAGPGEAVSVEFRGAERRARADALGRWRVYLPPGDAGGPFAMTIRGTNTIVLRDVLVGEVWVAAGQSNMEWPIAWAGNAKEEIAVSAHPRIRLVRAMHRVSDYPMPDLVGQMWRECSPE